MAKWKHGQSIKGAETRTYKSWHSMRSRCNNPNDPSYKNYGGRGIKVCDRWKDFRNFFQDMGDRPQGLTIDRIENDGNYESSNCQWATQKEQRHNSRQNKLSSLKVQVIKKLLRESNLLQKDIAEIFKIVPSTVYQIKVGKIWNDMHYGGDVK